MSFRGNDSTRRLPDAAGDGNAAEVDVDTLELEDLDAATFQPRGVGSALPLRRPLRRGGSSHGEEDGDNTSSAQTTTRLLEALEALSSETGGAMPPSLRSLLGQLQGDDSGMAGLLPFMQLLDTHASHPQFQNMLQSIGADAPAHIQLSGLSELCESLSMSSEDGLMVSGFSVDKFLPRVVHLIQSPSTMDVLLLATRALSAMLDMFPSTAIPRAMATDAKTPLVPAICDKLLEIEYMDVAEMAFQILERIVFSPQAELAALATATATASTATTTTTTLSSLSSRPPRGYRRAVIEANGFVALLQFVDFFPIENQRTAAHVVAGLCTNIGAESIGELQVALPLVANLLRSSDPEIVQHACKSFEALSQSAVFTSTDVFAEMVANDDTCETLLQLLGAFASRNDSDHGAESSSSSSSSSLSVASCASLLQFMLAVLSSPHTSMKALVAKLRFTGLPPIVAKLLDVPELVEDVVLLRETLKVVSAILPPAETLTQATTQDEKQTMLAFAQGIVASVIHVFEVSGRREVRYDCLSVLLRVSLLQQQQREHQRENVAGLDQLASFLARVLRPESTSSAVAARASQRKKNEARHLCVALQIVQACLQSSRDHVPSPARALFERHGVSAAIRSFANSTETVEGGDGGVVALSKLLVVEYLGEESSSAAGAADEYEQLRSSVRRVENVMNEPSGDRDAHAASLSDALRGLLALCQRRRENLQSASGGLWLTAHEITASGLSRLLARLFQDADGRRVFADVFLVSSAMPFVEGLVACVQDAISAEKDAFRVETTLAGSSVPISTGSVVGDMDQLTQHIKVKVKIEDASAVSCATSGKQASALENPNVKRNKRIVHNTVVLVEPLARIDTIEEFITEKLFGSRARLGAAFEEEDDYDDDDDEEEEEEEEDANEDEQPAGSRGRRRRARRRDSADGEEKGNDTEDEEEDGEGEDGEEEEEDHDEDDADVFRSDKRQKRKRVEVSYDGVVLRSDSSVLEAILKSDSSSSVVVRDAASDLTKVWTGAPHEFVFRVLPKKQDKEQTTALPSDMVSVPATAAAPLSVPLPSQWWDDVWDLLEILTHLHELVVLHETHDAAVIDSSRGTTKKQFENAYICLQVTRALAQPIRVMTNSLPSWCFRIADKFPFVLDYETRYDFMYATTSGTPRAISYLCRTLWKKTALAEDSMPSSNSSHGGLASRLSRRMVRDRSGSLSSSASSRTSNATAALTNLTRMAKLPRLKVRVARARLLQSAMKLFAMYGGKKAIVEIEFLGEVGTGLGPTTEFYTLVCHELQAARLKLWRNDKEVPAVDAAAASGSKAVVKTSEKEEENTTKKTGLPIRGYHRIAVTHCSSCKHLEILRCPTHDQLLTHEKTETDGACGTTTTRSIPQCSKCLDAHDWYSSFQTCKACDKATKQASTTSLGVATATAVAAAASEDDPSERLAVASANGSKPQCILKWWILSDEEAQYLQKVYPRDAETIKHPVLQCSHCETVNFPGTDAGIVELDHTGQRMVSRAGRRMFERDYRAVTKHVSPLCEGTPLKQIGVQLTRGAVDTLADGVKKSPELLESEVESLSYMSEVGGVASEIDVVEAPFGLFPKPYKPLAQEGTKKESSTKPKPKTKAKPTTTTTTTTMTQQPTVLSWFNFMGRFVAQAILDERLLNLPLSRAFLRALRGETLVGSGVATARSLAFVHEVDPAIAQSLRYLATLATKIAQAKSDGDARGSLNELDAEVEAMCLAFTLVGDASIELCANGANVAVTAANLGEYVELNLRFLLHDTIQPQVEAFHTGFGAVIHGEDAALHFLQRFSLRELEFLLADQSLPGDSLWDREGKELRDSMVCDHGYTPHSRAIHDLVAVLCEFTLEEQRLFVKFVTGANRLPLGGLAKLEPKLTVVRKLGGDGGDDRGHVDAVLPSASTCTNYLKLPEYSTRAAMKGRLLYCIHEGQGSFHLS